MINPNHNHFHGFSLSLSLMVSVAASRSPLFDFKLSICAVAFSKILFSHCISPFIHCIHSYQIHQILSCFAFLFWIYCSLAQDEFLSTTPHFSCSLSHSLSVSQSVTALVCSQTEFKIPFSLITEYILCKRNKIFSLQFPPIFFLFSFLPSSCCCCIGFAHLPSLHLVGILCGDFHFRLRKILIRRKTDPRMKNQWATMERMWKILCEEEKKWNEETNQQQQHALSLCISSVGSVYAQCILRILIGIMQ